MRKSSLFEVVSIANKWRRRKDYCYREGHCGGTADAAFHTDCSRRELKIGLSPG